MFRKEVLNDYIWPTLEKKQTSPYLPLARPAQQLKNQTAPRHGAQACALP